MLTVLFVLLAATAVGMMWRGKQGKMRTVQTPPRSGDARPGAADAGLGHEVRALGAELGDRATLVQFSSAFCAPCRATRTLLAHVADTEPGVVHLEVDAERHLELVRRLDVRKTPTTLVLDRDGREVRRATGAPSKADVLAALPA